MIDVEAFFVALALIGMLTIFLMMFLIPFIGVDP